MAGRPRDLVAGEPRLRQGGECRRQRVECADGRPAQQRHRVHPELPRTTGRSPRRPARCCDGGADSRSAPQRNTNRYRRHRRRPDAPRFQLPVRRAGRRAGGRPLRPACPVRWSRGLPSRRIRRSRWLRSGVLRLPGRCRPRHPLLGARLAVPAGADRRRDSRALRDARGGLAGEESTDGVGPGLHRREVPPPYPAASLPLGDRRGVGHGGREGCRRSRPLEREGVPVRAPCRTARATRTVSATSGRAGDPFAVQRVPPKTHAPLQARRPAADDRGMSGIRAIQERVTSSSGGYAVKPAPLPRRESISRAATRYAVLALTIGCIVTLGVLKAAGVDSGPATDALRALFGVAFVVLTLVDFRASVAIAIFELVLGGAGGRGIDYGGGLTGRIFMDAVVTVRALWLTIVDWRRGRSPLLGRYGAHAIAIAILIPAIWIPLGLLEGNGRHNAVSDGNGFVFFAFVLVIVALLRAGDGGWFRRLFFAACAVNGVAYFVLIVVSTSGAVSLVSVRECLSVRLSMGGVIGYMPNGDYRLFTAGSLFVQVALVLPPQQLLVRPRNPWVWLLGAILTVDLIATYTRGLWLSALVSVLLLLVLEVRNARQLGLALGIPAAVGALALAITPLWGFSLYGYVFHRAATITDAGQRAFRGSVTNPGFERSLQGWGVSAAKSLRVLRTGSAARAGTHSLQLSNSKADVDAFAFQNLAFKPKTDYALHAWVNSRAFRQPAAGERGVVIWDAQDGLLYTVPLTTSTDGWKRLSFTFPTGKKAKDIQIRLYAPEGRVQWDAVRLTSRGHAVAGTRTSGPVRVSSI